MRHALITLAILLLAGCQDRSMEGEAGSTGTAATGNSGSSSAAAPLKVVCTTGMIADMVQNIGREHIELYCMMGPGVDPHLYQATTGDVQALADADIVFYNGLHLEAKLGDLLVKLASQRPVVAVTQDIDESELLSPAEFEGLHDPHVWMDVELWRRACDTVRNALLEKLPEFDNELASNYGEYYMELMQLEIRLRDMSAMLPQDQRVLITAHDAFNYFGRAYGFEVRGLQGISTQAEAGTADVRDLADFIVERRIPAIFVESSVPQRNIEAVQAACASRGFEVAIGGELYSDAMGGAGTKEGTYVGMIEHNMRTVVTALGADLTRLEKVWEEEGQAQ